MKRAPSIFDLLMVIVFVAIIAAILLPAVAYHRRNAQSNTLILPITSTTTVVLDRYSSPRSIKEMTYDGCQYLLLDSYSGGYSITHKGNCTNSIHRQ